MDERKLLIGVIGAGQAESHQLAVAEEVGRLLAQAGVVLVCGGLGGVMEAACRGARGQGGETVGLLPGPDPTAANPHVSIPLATNLGQARNALIAQSCTGLIAVAGEYGTLSEIALGLKLGKPVVGVGCQFVLPGLDVAPSALAGVNLLMKRIGRS